MRPSAKLPRPPSVPRKMLPAPAEAPPTDVAPIRMHHTMATTGMGKLFPAGNLFGGKL